MAKKKKTSTTKTPSTPSFEDGLEKLRSIVHELEQGNLSLDESLKKYEAGVKHLNQCYASLKAVQRKIEVLVDLDENGRMKTVPFDDQATDFQALSADDDEDYDEDVVDDPESLF